MARKKADPTIDLVDGVDLQTLTKQQLIKKLIVFETQLKEEGQIRKITPIVTETPQVVEHPSAVPISFKMDVVTNDNSFVQLKNLNDIVGFLTNNNIVKSVDLSIGSD